MKACLKLLFFVTFFLVWTKNAQADTWTHDDDDFSEQQGCINCGQKSYHLQDKMPQLGAHEYAELTQESDKSGFNTELATRVFFY